MCLPMGTVAHTFIHSATALLAEKTNDMPPAVSEHVGRAIEQSTFRYLSA